MVVVACAGRAPSGDGNGTPRPCPEGECSVYLTRKGADPWSSGTASAADETDAGGGIEIEAVLPGTYAVQVWAQRYRKEDVYPDVVVGTDDVTGQVWKVHSGSTLVGTVRTKSGQPVDGASVSAQSVGGDPRGQRTPGRVGEPVVVLHDVDPCPRQRVA